MTIESMNLLNPFAPKDHSYSGRESYRYVERILRNERNLLIVSPYIDDYYAKYLVGHSRGKRIRILSSSMQPGAARRLRGGGPGLVTKFLIVLASLNLLFYLAGAQVLAFLAVSSFAAVLSFMFSFRKRSNISVRVPKDFVHAKMYLGDGVAAVCSANLTYAGMHRNIEHIDVIRDRKRIGDLKRQFSEMWDSA